MIKKLPIEIKNVKIMSECWTFNKVAIIQTSKYADAWLASHFNLLIDSSNSIYFGEWLRQYSSMYYDDILSINCIDFKSMREVEIIEVIKHYIDNGNYVSIISNWDLQNKEIPSFHEILIYGYNDEEKVFYAPLMENRIFRETEVSFSHINKWLVPTKEYLKNLGQTFYTMEYQHPMAIYTLKDNYVTDSCAYMALRKIDYESWGVQLTRSILSEYMTVYDAPKHFTGIACLTGLRDILYSLQNNIPLPAHFMGLTNTIRKLYEHRGLLLLSMKYIINAWDIKNDIAVSCIDAYDLCYKNIEKWLSMSLKYEQTQDESILNRIHGEIFSEFSSEAKILREFYNNCIHLQDFALNI